MYEKEKKYVNKLFEDYSLLLSNNTNFTLLENKLSSIDSLKYDKELDIEKELIEIHKSKEIANNNENLFYNNEKYFYYNDNEPTQFETNFNTFISDFNNNLDDFCNTNFEKNNDIEKEKKIEELANDIIDEIINQEFNIKKFLSLFVNEFYQRMNNNYEKIIFD